MRAKKSSSCSAEWRLAAGQCARLLFSRPHFSGARRPKCCWRECAAGSPTLSTHFSLGVRRLSCRSEPWVFVWRLPVEIGHDLGCPRSSQPAFECSIVKGHQRPCLSSSNACVQYRDGVFSSFLPDSVYRTTTGYQMRCSIERGCIVSSDVNDFRRR